MRILDIDMDYFLKDVPMFISENSKSRLCNEDYTVWTKKEVIEFLEERLGLSNERKIKGKIVVNHHEALYYWHELISKQELSIPFEVVHIDSHADMGLGYPSWTFIMDSLLKLPVCERADIENYKNIFEKYYEPGIGDYLLFVLAFRWINKLTYVCNPAESGDDYLWMSMKDGIEPNTKIQLTHNENMRAVDIMSGISASKYYSTAIREPEVDFEIIREVELVNYNGDFDYITFCISPNYTPASADFIIEIIKEYIDAE